MGVSSTDRTIFLVGCDTTRVGRSNCCDKDALCVGGYATSKHRLAPVSFILLLTWLVVVDPTYRCHRQPKKVGKAGN